MSLYVAMVTISRHTDTPVVTTDRSALAWRSVTFSDVAWVVGRGWVGTGPHRSGDHSSVPSGLVSRAVWSNNLAIWEVDSLLSDPFVMLDGHRLETRAAQQSVAGIGESLPLNNHSSLVRGSAR